MPSEMTALARVAVALWGPGGALATSGALPMPALLLAAMPASDDEHPCSVISDALRAQTHLCAIMGPSRALTGL
eukprot:5171009-Pyramimonas_sp.AAC.1